MTPPANASMVVRAAASVLWRGLVAVAGLHLYWAVGGTRALDEASGGAYTEATTSVRVQSAVIAILLALASVVVRMRVGLWRARVSQRVVRLAMWALTAVLSLAALVNFAASTNWERFVVGPVVLALTLLSLVVARSGGEAPRVHRTLPTT